jgi:ABC-type branched-subunit amino acid transport system substrate-binding protein
MTKRSRAIRVGAALAVLSLVGAACGGSDDSASEDTSATEEVTEETTAEEMESTCGMETSDTVDGDLAGFSGSTPFGEGGADAAFIERLCSVDPALIDVSYAAETYDSIVTIALAVEMAQSDGIEYASEINGITRDGEKCTDFSSCLDIIKAGGDPDYDGISGPLTFAGNGEPLEASYGFLTMNDSNRIDPTLTTFIDVKGPDELDVPQVEVQGSREGDGVLTLGSILPQTGNLAFLGPPMFAAFDLAVQDINAAGGVLGQPVVAIKGDSGDTSTDTASKTVDRLLAENADAIIGAASSGVSLTVIDKVASAGVVLFSPANTSPALSDYDDKGLYFRTAPPDIYQGDVLGQKVLQDGSQTVAILALNDAYGTGLADAAEATITAGGGEVVVKTIYDPTAASFETEVDAVVAADPDAIIVIGFDESAKILKSMVEKGIGPKVKKVYGCDGNIGNALGKAFEELG